MKFEMDGKTVEGPNLKGERGFSVYQHAARVLADVGFEEVSGLLDDTPEEKLRVFRELVAMRRKISTHPEARALLIAGLEGCKIDGILFDASAPFDLFDDLIQPWAVLQKVWAENGFFRVAV